MTTRGTTEAPAGDASPFDPPAEDQPWLAVADRAAGEFAPRAAHYDETAGLPLENLQRLHELGLDAAWLPREYGGQGLSYRSFGTALTAIARACPSTACIWLMHVGAAQALVSLGNPGTARFFADQLLAGKRFANALSEPTSGNMFLVPLQSADPVPGGFRLDGAKRFVSGSEVADHLLVNTLVDGVPSFFGVDRDDTMAMVPIWDTMGLRASRSQLISFEGTLLPADRRCAPPSPADASLIAAGLPFLSIGVAEAAFAALAEHARGRVIPSAGTALAELPWVRFAAADAQVELRAARLLAQETMWLADHGSPRAMFVALEAKLKANEVANQIAALGVRVGGASGYLRTSPIQRHFRDAQAGALMAYSTEVCRDAIGAAVLQG
jgi:alkylation response protein AidB-like acyl-CoA dehydrogenase